MSELLTYNIDMNMPKTTFQIILLSLTVSFQAHSEKTIEDLFRDAPAEPFEDQLGQVLTQEEKFEQQEQMLTSQ